MKRRKFGSLCGSAVFSGFALSTLQKPSVGIDFELVVPNSNTEPTNINSLLVKFDHLVLTPQNLNENSTMDIIIKFELDDGSKSVRKSSDIGFRNGEKLELDYIEDETSDISTLYIDGIDATGSLLKGTLTVEIDHPDINNIESYSRNLSIYDDSAIPSGGPVQEQWETETQLIQDWWNNNWKFNTTNSSVTEDRSFKDNRFGVTNAIEVHVDEWVSERAWYETTEFDLSKYSNLHVHGEGRGDNKNIDGQELEVYIDGNLEFKSSYPKWQEINIDLSGNNSNNEIRLGYFNRRGSFEQGTYSEFYLE